MSAIPAGELKKRGVSVLDPVLEEYGEAVISVRGQGRYVVLTMEKYNELRELELVRAVKEARADYQAGRIPDKSIDGHMERITGDV